MQEEEPCKAHGPTNTLACWILAFISTSTQDIIFKLKKAWTQPIYYLKLKIGNGQKVELYQDKLEKGTPMAQLISLVARLVWS